LEKEQGIFTELIFLYFVSFIVIFQFVTTNTPVHLNLSNPSPIIQSISSLNTIKNMDPSLDVFDNAMCVALILLYMNYCLGIKFVFTYSNHFNTISFFYL